MLWKDQIFDEAKPGAYNSMYVEKNGFWVNYTIIRTYYVLQYMYVLFEWVVVDST